MKRLLTVILSAVALIVALTAPAQAGGTDNADLHSFADGTLIGSGAHTNLQRDVDGVDLGVHSRSLAPGAAYTVWFVVFNDPSQCEAAPAPCGEADAFDEEGNPTPDGPANPSVIWSGVGGVANAAGNLNASGSAGEGLAGSSQILFGDGIVDAEVAELHAILRYHGPASDDPDVLEAQITTFMGGCDVYVCEDVQFSIHQA